MPLYKYKCLKCGQIIEKLTPPGILKNVNCKCGGMARKIISKSLKPAVKVLLDKYRNKSVLCNINKIMKKCSWNYQKRYESDEMIANHGLTTIQKQTDFFDPETGLLRKDKK